MPRLESVERGSGGSDEFSLDDWPAVAVRIGKDGKLIWGNRYVTQALQYQPEELIGREFNEFVHPEDLAAAEECLEQLSRGRRVLDNQFRIISGEGEYRWYSFDANPVQGNVFTLLGRDVSEQRRVLDDQAALLEFCPDALLALDGEGKVTWVNAAAERLFGYPRPMLKQRRVDDLLSLGTDQLLERRSGYTVDCEAVREDGSRLSVQLQCAAVAASQSSYERLLSLRDNNHREVEETLQTTGTNLGTLEDGQWVRDVQEDRVYWSDESAALFGLEPGLRESSRDVFLECLHEADRERVLRETAEAYGDSSRQTHSTEFRIVRNDGERHIASNLRLCRDDDGQVHRVIGTARDVTRLRQAEQALHEQQELFNALIDSDEVLILVVDSKGHILTINGATEALIGRRQDEVHGKSISDLVLEGEERTRFAATLSGIKQNSPALVHVSILDGRGGVHRPVAFSFKVVTDEKGVVQYAIATGIPLPRDSVVERASTPDVFRSLVELGFDMTAVQCDHVIVDINAKGAALLGARSPEDLLGRPITDIIHPDYHSVVFERIHRTIIDKNQAQLMDQRLVRFDGSVIDVEVASVPTEYDGRPATHAVFRDVTHRKRAEAALRAREHYFESLAKVAPVGIYQCNVDGQVTYANRRCSYILGISADRLTGSNWRSYVHPQDFERVIRQWSEATERGRPFKLEYRYCRPEGDVVWVLSQAVAERDKSGRILGYIGTITDVTELKELHQRLAEAEERARKVVELAFDMVMLQCEHVVVDLNEPGARLLGLNSPEEFLGRPLADLFPAESHQEVFEHIRDAVVRWEPTSLAERKLLRTDGRMVDVEGAVIPVLYQGRPATYAVYRDISQRKHKERALRDRQHHFQTLAKAAPVGIFQSTLHGECTYVNERYVEITGHGYSASLGDAWKRHVHPEDIDRVVTELGACRDNGRPFRLEYRVCRADGEVIWVLGQAVVEGDASGNPLGYIGTITDITESKHNALELQCYREQLEQMVRDRTRELAVVNRELEAFSYSVSHDLRAPLRAINGFTQALYEDHGDQFDERSRFYLDRIRTNSNHMGALIEDLLELSRVSQVELHSEVVDLSALARTLTDEMRMADPGRDVEVLIQEGLSAVGDRKLLRSLLQNLLGNAWKYTGKTAHPRIEFGCREMDGRPVFLVADNGVGFDMDAAEELFNAFCRLHSSSEFEGTGIGLATVKRIVSRHGGRVWGESEAGQGATFFFSLDQ